MPGVGEFYSRKGLRHGVRRRLSVGGPRGTISSLILMEKGCARSVGRSAKPKAENLE